MPYPIDTLKLDRVRALMKEQEMSALVVRAPDNVLYLTNYWCMKGYDAAVFPPEGDPTLIALEPQLADAQRNSWTKDIRVFKGYDERDPRPPQLARWLVDPRGHPHHPAEPHLPLVLRQGREALNPSVHWRIVPVGGDRGR